MVCLSRLYNLFGMLAHLKCLGLGLIGNPAELAGSIKPLPGWLEELEKAKREIRRRAELNGLYAWQTGGAHTDRVQNRWQQYYNRSFSPQHRYIIYRGIDNNDFAIWLERQRHRRQARPDCSAE